MSWRHSVGSIQHWTRRDRGNLPGPRSSIGCTRRPEALLGRIVRVLSGSPSERLSWRLLRRVICTETRDARRILVVSERVEGSGALLRGGSQRSGPDAEMPLEVPAGLRERPHRGMS
jgi:hypothetical protein